MGLPGYDFALVLVFGYWLLFLGLLEASALILSLGCWFLSSVVDLGWLVYITRLLV